MIRLDHDDNDDKDHDDFLIILNHNDNNDKDHDELLIRLTHNDNDDKDHEFWKVTRNNMVEEGRYIRYWVP